MKCNSSLVSSPTQIGAEKLADVPKRVHQTYRTYELLSQHYIKSGFQDYLPNSFDRSQTTVWCEIRCEILKHVFKIAFASELQDNLEEMVPHYG